MADPRTLELTVIFAVASLVPLLAHLGELGTQFGD
jgi:hypothetical protein